MMLLGALAAALTVTSGLLAPAQAQESQKDRVRRLLEGTEVFRRILYDKNCVSLKDFQDLVNEPEHCILIVLGDANAIRKIPDRTMLDWFLGEAGGAALIASDRPMSGDTRQNLEAVAGVRISGKILEEFNEADCYRRRFCPCLKPAKGTIPPLFGEKSEYRVAANLSSFLVPPLGKRVFALPEKVGPIAYLPNHAGIYQGEEFVPIDQPTGLRRFTGLLPMATPLFAVGGDVGAGRILVLADHSIFINEMMLPTDNQNVEFTEACVEWLQGEGRQRNRVLFVEDGTPQTKFDIPLKSANIPLDDAAKAIFDRRNDLLAEAEKGLAQLENDNAFNRGFVELLYGSGLPPMRLVGYLLSFGALALLLWCIGRGIRRRFHHDTSVPALAQTLGKRLPAEPVMEQRHAVLLRQGNLWEPAALLARRWFVRLGVERTDGPEPVFAAKGGWWQRRKVVGRLRQLWRLACGAQPQRVTAPELWRLERELEELRGEWERGGWHVAGAV
jgi:hypothetical protein